MIFKDKKKVVKRREKEKKKKKRGEGKREERGEGKEEGGPHFIIVTLSLSAIRWGGGERER